MVSLTWSGKINTYGLKDWGIESLGFFLANIGPEGRVCSISNTVAKQVMITWKLGHIKRRIFLARNCGAHLLIKKMPRNPN